MRELIKSLFTAAVTVGLSDRDAFVNKVSEVIKEYQDDPAKAEKWAKAVVDYMEQTKDNIRLQQAIKTATSETGLAGKEHMEELTQAIKKLTEELQKHKEI